MRKIPTIYVRDPEDMRRLTSERHPDCGWVFAGEGVPTRKFDGTCVMLDVTGFWWARREVKPGKEPPPEFVLAETDENTGKTMGWEPVTQSGFAKWHALALTTAGDLDPGTYELIGEKINGNPERIEGHELVRHGVGVLVGATSPEVLIEHCREQGWEGVVWHHPDGRMAKLKVKDVPA